MLSRKFPELRGHSSAIFLIAIFLDSKAERVGIFLSAHLKPQKFWIPLNSESFHDLLTGLEIILYSVVTLSKSKFDYHDECCDGEV